MTTVVRSFGLAGVNAYSVTVETATLHGQPSVNIVGLGDAAVKEAAHRLQAAFIAAHFEFPKMKVVINLAPSGDWRLSWIYVPVPAKFLLCWKCFLRWKLRDLLLIAAE